MNWPIHELAGTADELHHLETGAERGAWLLHVDRPTLVLGSAQSADILDHERLEASGVVVARRRSGGGLVGLEPGGSLWVDVVVPVDDPLWRADVGRSFLWLGETWRSTVAAFGLDGVVVDHPHRDRAWSELICFAGHNTGEVLVGEGKVVGLSQRRTREMARFQALVLLDPSLDLVIDHLALGDGDRERLRTQSSAMTAAVPASADVLVERFLDELAGR
ncbi:MAG: lipoyl protein ligase domain-containing protein [Acidimicrobiales bacterium]